MCDPKYVKWFCYKIRLHFHNVHFLKDNVTYEKTKTGELIYTTVIKYQKFLKRITWICKIFSNNIDDVMIIFLNQLKCQNAKLLRFRNLIKIKGVKKPRKIKLDILLVLYILTKTPPRHIFLFVLSTNILMLIRKIILLYFIPVYFNVYFIPVEGQVVETYV